MLEASNYRCNLSTFSINLLLPEGSSYWLGLARASIFSGFVLYNMRKSVLVRRNDFNAAKALVLPMLIKLIYAYILLNVTVAVVGIATYEVTCADRFKGVFLALQMGAFHTLLEGLAFYLMRYGTGWKAIRDSLVCGCSWGCVTFVVYFVQMTLFCGTYEIMGLPIDPDSKRLMWLGVSCGYNSILLVFYLTFLVVPINWLYRRPALRLYSRFQCIYQVFWIITSALIFHDKDTETTVCVLSSFAIILMVCIHPIITYLALRLDSQYWQGLVPEEGNPLADWGSVSVETATSMARGVAELEKVRTVQMLHFGLLELDSKLGFVPGGFSRVYFGLLRGKEQVAVKVIYTIELSRHEIAHFCREAKILDKLRHENIVHCHGVCVMPPALALIFENCKYGSLFSFLYVATFSAVPSEEDVKAAAAAAANKPFSLLEAIRSHPLVAMNGNQVMSPLVGGGGGFDTRISSVDFRRTSASLGPDKGGEKMQQCVLLQNLEPALPHSPSSNLLKLSSVLPSRRGDQALNHDVIPAAASTQASDSSADMEAGGLTLSRKTTINLEVEMSQSFARNNTLPAKQTLMDFNVHRLSSTLSFEDRVSLMLDAAVSIAFMHSKGYLHCDIKSLNFLVCDVPDEPPAPPPSPRSPSQTKPRAYSSPSSSPTSSPAASTKVSSGLSNKYPARTLEERGGCKYMLKLADMGEARTKEELEGMIRPPIPSRNWAPPEVLVADAKAEAYTASSDVFGLALVLSEIALLSLPFGESVDSLTQEEWLQRIENNSFRPILPPSMHPDLRALLMRGWRSNPAERCTADDMVDVLRGILDELPSR